MSNDQSQNVFTFNESFKFPIDKNIYKSPNSITKEFANVNKQSPEFSSSKGTSVAKKAFLQSFIDKQKTLHI